MSIEGDLPGRIGQAMKRRRVNQVALAEALGTGQPTVSGWLNRISLPDATALQRLPGIPGVSGHWLLTGRGSMDEPGRERIEPFDQAREEVSAELVRRVRVAVEAALATESAPGDRELRAGALDVVGKKRGKGSPPPPATPPGEETG